MKKDSISEEQLAALKNWAKAEKRFSEEYIDVLLDRIYKKYKGLVWKIINDKIPDFQSQDRLDVLSDVFTAFIETVKSGEFRGEYGEVSVLAFLYSVTKKKCADLIRDIEAERENRVYEPENQDAYDEDGDNFKDDWLGNFENEDNLLGGYMPSPKEIYEAKIKREAISKTARHSDILALREERYTIKEIAEKLGLTYYQVQQRLKREKERYYKSQESLNNKKPINDNLYNLITSAPTEFYDKTKRNLKEEDFEEMGYRLPADERTVRKYPKFYKGHRKLINRIRRIQNTKYKNEAICVKCGKWTKREETIEDNKLLYCKLCYGKIKKL